MDYNSRVSSLDQLRAHGRLAAALEHLTSKNFLDLPEDEKKAHAAAYRAELPNLKARIPQHPTSLNSLHLLGTYLELFE